MSTHNIGERGAGTIQHNYESIHDDKPVDQLDAELAHEMAKRTDKVNDATLDLAVRLKAAREFMSWSASHLKKTWLDWQDQSGKAVRELTQDRMVFDRESKAIIGAAKDVRDFYNSAEYVAAHARLKEMVELLSRFSAFKQDGTLDAFADFILKVSK